MSGLINRLLADHYLENGVKVGGRVLKAPEIGGVKKPQEVKPWKNQATQEEIKEKIASEPSGSGAFELKLCQNCMQMTNWLGSICQKCKKQPGAALPEPVIPSPLPDAMDILASNLEQPCCQHPTRPCKHWVWDSEMGDGYKNVLSGRYREAD